MTEYSVGQDEFQMRLFFMSFLFSVLAAFKADEITPGINFFLMEPGTMHEIEVNSKAIVATKWTQSNKIIVLCLFATMGSFGGSCSCAITKRFGALTMSITSTTRKAATVLISFVFFPNECTFEHIMGIIIFTTGFFVKSYSLLDIKKEKGWLHSVMIHK